MLRESKVIRLFSIINNGIILDLVCGFSGCVGEDVHADFSFIRGEILLFLSEGSQRERW